MSIVNLMPLNASTLTERFMISSGYGGWKSGGKEPHAGEPFTFSIHVLDNPETHKRWVEMARENGVFLKTPDRARISLSLKPSISAAPDGAADIIPQFDQDERLVTDRAAWTYMVTAWRPGMLMVNCTLACQDHTIWSDKTGIIIGRRQKPDLRPV